MFGLLNNWLTLTDHDVFNTSWHQQPDRTAFVMAHERQAYLSKFIRGML